MYPCLQRFAVADDPHPHLVGPEFAEGLEDNRQRAARHTVAHINQFQSPALGGALTGRRGGIPGAHGIGWHEDTARPVCGRKEVDGRAVGDEESRTAAKAAPHARNPQTEAVRPCPRALFPGVASQKPVKAFGDALATGDRSPDRWNAEPGTGEGNAKGVERRLMDQIE